MYWAWGTAWGNWVKTKETKSAVERSLMLVRVRAGREALGNARLTREGWARINKIPKPTQTHSQSHTYLGRGPDVWECVTGWWTWGGEETHANALCGSCRKTCQRQWRWKKPAVITQTHTYTQMRGSIPRLQSGVLDWTSLPGGHKEKDSKKEKQRGEFTKQLQVKTLSFFSVKTWLLYVNSNYRLWLIHKTLEFELNVVQKRCLSPFSINYGKSNDGAWNQWIWSKLTIRMQNSYLNLNVRK